MSASVGIANLLPDPSAVPVEQIPTLLGELEKMKATLWARLTTPNVRAVPAAPEVPPLTQHEAATRYRIPLRTLRHLTRTRRVPSYQQGRNRMVRPADLDHYLARCRAQGVKVGAILDG